MYPQYNKGHLAFLPLEQFFFLFKKRILLPVSCYIAPPYF